MRKYYISVIIEGNVNDVVSFKNLVTNSDGYFDPHSYFMSFSLPPDPSLPKELLFGNYDFFDPDELIVGEKSKMCFESFWNQSINGYFSGNRSRLFQLKISFDAIVLFQSEWYAVSKKFPDLLFFISFSDSNENYEGHLIFSDGKIYRSSSQEYFKDRDGYSICLDKKMNWFYVRPLDLKWQGLDPLYVYEDKLVQLIDQLSEVVDPIEFCSHFPVESFPGWQIIDDRYFQPRPNTVFYPYPMKVSELAALGIQLKDEKGGGMSWTLD
ncbi:MAG: hypothetical protein FJX88_06185 [Bacteroidetes bacterium]|nr:hypothetical protein [Bacteroidota bacterium]